jgi:hypothetical protein
MKFTYDAAKNDSNITKHGLPLSDAKLLDWNAAFSWVDQKKIMAKKDVLPWLRLSNACTA